MENIKALLAALCLCMAATAASAEVIVWDQPSSRYYGENIYFEGNSVLHKADVRKLQRALAKRGFYKGKIDGIWGGQTTQAILDYQGVNEQPLTGTVTIGTLRDLGVRVNKHQYRR